MPAEPLVRARQLRSLLEHVDQLPEPERRAVRDGLEPAVLSRIESSATSDWLPFALDLELTHAIERALGPKGKHEFFQRHQLDAWRGPLLRTLVDTATALFGLDPGSWVRWIPRGWGIVFRNAGEWQVDRSAAGEIELALVDAPASVLEDESWLRSLASSFSSFLVLAKAEGEFAFDHVDRAHSAACFRLRWRKPGGS